MPQNIWSHLPENCSFKISDVVLKGRRFKQYATDLHIQTDQTVDSEKVSFHAVNPQ
jgi:hypothetical protein